MTAETLSSDVTIHPIPAFTDNYIWCIHNGNSAIVVDPGDAEPVLAFLKANNLMLSAVLITHHHRDHTGGIAKLVSTVPDLPVIGPRGNHIRGITKSVAQGDTVSLPVFKMALQVMEVPGHTLDHIAFFGHGILFCGDTLFSAGCGRLFEGSPEQMHHSLNKLKRLPDTTKVYGAHEYTQANVEFALAVEPDNTALNDYADWVNAKREQNQPTLPSNLKEQKSINPFLRAHELSVKTAAEAYCESNLADDVAVFAAVRRWKDEF
ncbi:hydroxyacylglutathione hydrolase [Alteromonas sp. BL110]|uniref:hydroxyacylglutathione hydrolase n=1 Tax=Alteromonas sp. BL110 TaxID=1714845 RepID=UPI000E4FB4AD|nr:hydroxyacylglutathione hydrolase [Alteromonas sp. BL110]AXT39945.1 hydroxyacylglutathione hydrolase [Alteromonas sp. BL110]RKM79175.1 hydroxyacylglutathione hydrolase [Alteromonas sp. BL110]